MEDPNSTILEEEPAAIVVVPPACTSDNSAGPSSRPGRATGMGTPPRPFPAKKGLPRPAKKQVLPRPAKIGKTCGAGRGKVYLNPLKIRPLSVPIRFVRQ